MGTSLNTSHLLEALLFVFQLKVGVSAVKDISLSGDKMDHRNEMVPHAWLLRSENKLWVDRYQMLYWLR